jgi:hypothetical protein
MKGHDSFRPRAEPARTIYDAFQAEASKRDVRSFEEWSNAEIEAVHAAARASAPAYGLRAPSREEVAKAEICARGHTDYGLQWACGVVDAMRKPVGEVRHV